MPAHPVIAPRQSSAARTALFEKFAWREIARENRLLDSLRRVGGPELTHLRIGLNDGVGELAVHARDLSDVNVEDWRAILVEPHGSDRPMGKAHVVHCLEESCRII